MIDILLTGIICATPIPMGASVADLQSAKCEFFATAKATTYPQCEMVRDAYIRSIGTTNTYGYFLCGAADGSLDNRSSLIAVPRQKFNSQKGF